MNLANAPVWILIVQGISLLQCAPLPQNAKPKDNAKDSKDLKNAAKYLQQFGYASQDFNVNDPKPSSLKKSYASQDFNVNDPEPSSLKKSLQHFQYFAHIPITGELDERTIKQMKKSRCGLKDPRITFEVGRKRRYNLQGNEWEFPPGSDRTLTWYLKNTASGIGYQVMRLVIYEALLKWHKVANINFKESPTSRKADIFVSFGSWRHGDSYSFDGRGGTLAHAFYPYKGFDLGGDIHFDNDEAFTYRKREGTDIMWVAVHEAGHSLGLEHSYEESAIMYPWYRGSSGGQFDLTEDDIRGIQALYGPRPKPNTKTKAPTATQAPTTTTATTTTQALTTTQAPTDPPTDAPVGPTKPTGMIGCMPKIDAVAQDITTGWMYIFSGKYFYLVSRRGLEHGPISFRSYFRALDEDVTAAYIRQNDLSLVLFSGSSYYIYTNFALTQGKRPVTDFGLPANTRVDAALQWQGSTRTTWVAGTRTYLFAGTQYYRYNEVSKKIDSNYPRRISTAWTGLPSSITGAATGFKAGGKRGETYFASGDKYYIFDNENIKVKPGHPRHIKKWLKCWSTQ